MAGASAAIAGLVIVADRMLLKGQPAAAILGVQIWSDISRAFMLWMLLPLTAARRASAAGATPRGRLAYLVLAGIFITIGESLFLLFLTLSSSQLATASLFRRLSLIVSFAIGVTVLRERPTRLDACASVLTLIGVIALSLG